MLWVDAAALPHALRPCVVSLRPLLYIKSDGVWHEKVIEVNCWHCLMLGAGHHARELQEYMC